MQNILQDLVVGNLFAFLLIFMRFGMVIMIMPGIGDSFVPQPIRLLFILAFCFVLTPVLAPTLPPIPSQSLAFFSLMISEAFIGVFIGTVMRIMISALDTAGLLVSMQASFSNALMFNPVTAAQGSVLGAIYASLGVTLLLVTDMHHYMLAAIVNSYQLFPVEGNFSNAADFSQAIVQIVASSFKIGVQIAMPFIVVGTMLQIGLGFLGRLMPQVQVFFLAQPIQIILSLAMLTTVLSAGMLYWMNGFENIVTESLAPK